MGNQVTKEELDKFIIKYIELIKQRKSNRKFDAYISLPENITQKDLKYIQTELQKIDPKIQIRLFDRSDNLRIQIWWDYICRKSEREKLKGSYFNKKYALDPLLWDKYYEV